MTTTTGCGGTTDKDSGATPCAGTITSCDTSDTDLTADDQRRKAGVDIVWTARRSNISERLTRRTRTTAVVAVLTAAVASAGCGGGGGTGSTRVVMNEQRATERAEGIVYQAVDGMSPSPTLQRTGLNPVGACLADEHGAGERRQVTLSYQLTGVPGTEAKQLVRQARDAWVRRGYTFQSSDADWSDPFPAVNMRTVPDDFWMTALTGVVDKAKGEGRAAITVTSPCFDAASPGA